MTLLTSDNFNQVNRCNYLKWQDAWLYSRVIHILQEVFQLNNKIQEILDSTAAIQVENAILKINLDSSRKKIDKLQAIFQFTIAAAIIFLEFALVYFKLVA